MVKETVSNNSMPAATLSNGGMHVTLFETHVAMRADNVAEITSGVNPKLRVAPPPEFGGPAGMWSPEQLFVASIESCLTSTCTYFTNRFDVRLASYSSTCRGTLEKRPEGLRFSRIEVNIEIRVVDVNTRHKAESLRLEEKLEKYCPVSAALNCPVHIHLNLKHEEDTE